jgi:two-component system LytT family response regulator
VQRTQQLIFSGATDLSSLPQSGSSTHPAPEESGEPTDPDDYFFVKTELKGKMLKINFRDIDYIEGMKNYVAIHHNGNRTMALLNMKDLEERLPARQFMRIHRSFIIALNKITSIEGNRVMLRNTQAEILLGETYRAPFLERMKGKIME